MLMQIQPEAPFSTRAVVCEAALSCAGDILWHSTKRCSTPARPLR